MNDLYWLALSRLPGVGGVTIRRLLAKFGSVEAIFAASDEALLTVPRVTAVTLSHLRQISLPALQQELLQLDQNGVQLLNWDDENYPRNLYAVTDAPPLIYVHGMLQENDTVAVGIVGTRQPTAENEAFAEKLGYELAQQGLTVVSGLALGVDTAAHRGALRAENGRTIAVLGGGVQNIYPSQNRMLAQEIMENGAILSEKQPHASVSAPDLAARNRIISGLATAVIVVESPLKGGAMITAKKALQQGRKLVAVAGSAGTNMLTEGGAVIVEKTAVDFEKLANQIKSHSIQTLPQQPRLL